jgi:hypothetical protein
MKLVTGRSVWFLLVAFLALSVLLGGLDYLASLDNFVTIPEAMLAVLLVPIALITSILGAVIFVWSLVEYFILAEHND